MDTDFILALARAAVEQPEPEPEPEQQLDERSLTLRLTLSPSRVVVCEQDRAVGIGGVAWQASVALSHAMGHDKQLFPSWAGQRVLELGCGTALCGLSAWALGAGDVVLTDAAQCGPVVQRSINATRVSAADDEPVGAITYAALRWGDPVPEAAAREFDVVVGSDLTYDTDDHQELLRTLVDVCQLNAHTRVVLAHQQRALSETVRTHDTI
jgi:predicted nicotinamide N-methyase